MGIFDTLLWWATAQVISLITLPCSWLFFRSFPAAGHAFHKSVGLLLFAFVAWSLMMLGVLPNTRWALLVVLALLAGLSLLALRLVPLPFERPELRTQALLVEVLFLTLFVACVFLRCASPMIAAGEKFMNFMLLNSILRSVRFPPQDAWAAGLSINYYYFGHLMVAYLTRLTGIASAVAFNLAQALFFGLSGLGAYGVAYTFAAVGRAEAPDRPASAGRMRPTLVGLLAAAMLLLMGNLFAGWKLVTDPAYLLRPFGDGVGWNSARVIETMENGRLLDQPITEFPAFALILADMHAHFMAMPFVLLAVGTAFLWFMKPDYALRPNRDRVVRTVGSAIIFGSLYVVTAWFLPACVGVWAAGVLVSLRQHGKLGSAKEALAWGTATTALAAVFFAPFYRTFVAPAADLQRVPYRTSFGQFCLIFGAFLVPVVAALCVTAVDACIALTRQAVKIDTRRRQRMPSPPKSGQERSATRSPATRRLSAARLGLVVLWIATTVTLALLARSYAVIVFSASVAMGVSVLAWHRQQSQPLVFALLLAGFAAILILVPEIYYLKDINPAPWMRANTVFKFHYQAWIFLAPACAFFIPYAAGQLAAVSRAGAWAFRSVVTVLIVSGLFYTAWVAPRMGGPCETLDGMAVYATTRPDETKAITWLANNAAPGSRLVESVGESYTSYVRASTFTGIPTVLGWRAHEHTWRGDWEFVKGRSREVRVFYTVADPAQARQFLHRYGISYIFVGEMERQRYGPSIERLIQWFPVLYQSGNVYVLDARHTVARQ